MEYHFWSLFALVLPLCFSEVLSLPSMTKGKPVGSGSLIRVTFGVLDRSHPLRNSLLALLSFPS